MERYYGWNLLGRVPVADGILREVEAARAQLLDPRATLAQLVERLIRNQQVAGSIPAGGSRIKSTV